MQLRWRRNPKTESGWFKWTAISLLAALAVFLVSMPVTFLVVLNHLQSTSPGDTQNALAALTACVVVGLLLGGLTLAGTMMIFLLFSFRGKRARAAGSAE
jgi:uncharacterized membrane protein YjgN (DUF898 family)